MSNIQRMFIHEAKKLGDYQAISVDDLANGYCKAKDEHDEAGKNKYIAALMLRFWYHIGKMQSKVKAVAIYDYDDLVMQLYKCIDAACDYRAWLDPTKKTNAQACIQQLIASRGAAEILYQSNLDKSKVNYNTISLDKPFEGDETEITLGDTLVDEKELEERRTNDSADAAVNIIQGFINKNKVMEAVILDMIAFNDCERHIKKTYKKVDENGEVSKYTETTSEFWEYRLVQALNDIDADYDKYFVDRYNICTEKISAVLETMKKYDNQKKYRCIRKCLKDARGMLTPAAI